MDKYLIIKASGQREERDASKRADLSEVQKEVRGYIEILYVFFEGKPAQLIVNDEGALKALPLNRDATRIYHESTEQVAKKRNVTFDHSNVRGIFGDVVILQGTAQIN